MSKKTKEINGKTYLLFNEQTDIVPVELTQWMEENFQKHSKTPFTNRDIYSYITRGHIPKRYGGNVIEIVKNIRYSKIIRIIK